MIKQGEKDDLICRYNSELEKHGSRVPVIMLATDTYDMLRKVGYKETEALKLTEIICNNTWQKEKISSLDYLTRIIEDLPLGQ